MNESLSAWEKFVLLIWKNFRAYWNHPTYFLLAIALPTIFTIPLVFMRFHIETITVSETDYEAINLESAWTETKERIENDKKTLSKTHPNFENSRFLPNISLAYAPDVAKDDDEFNNLLTKIKNRLRIEYDIQSCKNEGELEKKVREGLYFAGIVFVRFDVNLTDDSSDITYRLIFPSELRYYDDTFIGSGWSTNVQYDRVAGAEHRNPSDNTGGYVGYVREGFLMLQNAISLSFIEVVTRSTNLPEISIQRFQHKLDTYDPMIERMEVYLAFVVLTGFLYPCMFITWVLAKEKTTTMKEVLKIYAINYFLQFCAWFCYGVLILFAASIILVSISKIEWADGFSICTNGSWIALLIFLTSYSIASVAFCFMVTSCCKRSHTAIILLGLLWIATFLPLIIKVNQNIGDSMEVSLIMHLFSNTAMATALRKILEYEQYSNGFWLKHFFAPEHFDNNITVGITTVLFLVQCVLYLFIGLCADKIHPGAYGIGTNWLCMFSKPEKRRSSEKKRSSPMRQTKVFEVESQSKKLNVQIEKLFKTYKTDIIINDIHMCFFENEIVAIMGHNGSGKTTLLMMIVGLLKPTSGTISIYGFDNQKNKEIAQSFLGICLQHNMVLPDLSVSEQLRFYCYLKGMTNELEIEKEIVYYLRSTYMSEYYHVYIRRLSTGYTRILSVCCALCANSAVVVLDMPSVGMDLATRKILWSLLIKEKRNRTIILTTHCSAEAEALADRVAIIAGGELKCMGTTYFLKNMYGFGHRLVCLKGATCNVNKVTKVVKKIIPGAKPESNIGNELSYRLKLDNTETFAKILQLLEKYSKKLDLHGFYITNTTIDDICLSFGTSDPSEGEANRHAEIVNGISEYIDNYDDLDFLKPYTPYKGYRLLCYHSKALLYERFLYWSRMRALWIELIVLPTIIMAAVFFISQHNFEARKLPEIYYRLDNYGSTVTPIYADANESYIADIYAAYFAHSGRSHSSVRVNKSFESMDKFILSTQDEFNHTYKKYIIGASFESTKYVAYFNNYALHSAPLSLNVIHNAILNNYSDHSSILVSMKPLELKYDYHAADMRKTTSAGNFVVSTIAYCVVFVYSFPIMYIIRERQARLKLIKQISGLRPLVFWISSFAFDLIVTTTWSIILLGIIYIYQSSKILEYDLAIDFAVILFLFGIAIMPSNYLMSECFNNYILGYFSSVIFYIAGDVALAAVVDGMEKSAAHQEDLEIVEYIFRINPYFALSRAFYKAYKIGLHQCLCKKEDIKLLSIGLKCDKARPNCCVEYKVLSWEKFGVLREVASFFVLAIVCIIIIAMKEIYRSKFSSENPDPDIVTKMRSVQGSDHEERGAGLERRGSHTNTTDSELLLDTSALTEKARVLSLKHEQLQLMPLVLNKIIKRYKKFTAVNRLYLVVDNSDSVGLIGQNGDGKSVILKVLTGQEKLTSGSAFVHGINVTTDHYAMYHLIGYCPEDIEFLEQLTVYQLMKVLSMLHGVPIDEIEQRCECLAKVFGFYEDFDKQFSIVSYGNRRRLSNAIAFMGNPRMVYLDTPFKCIDPAGIRQQWNIFNIVRQAGKSLLIASSRPRECSAICTRFVVISHGLVQWLGTVHEINRLLPMDYLLKIKIKPYSDGEFSKRRSETVGGVQASVVTPYSRICLFVENEFHNSFLKEEDGLVLFFHIPNENTNLSEIFLKIQTSYVNIYIEDFTVSHTRLAVSLMDTVDHVAPLPGILRRQSSTVG